jgi:hypothetical protein
MSSRALRELRAYPITQLHDGSKFEHLVQSHCDKCLFMSIAQLSLKAQESCTIILQNRGNM